MSESHNKTIGRYQVLGPLGRGAMGLVYKARDPEIGRLVAVKTLRRLLPNQMQDADQAVERFRNEARSAGNLRHQNIITIFEIGRDGDMPYIVMDYVEGKPLDSILEKEGKLPLNLTLHYLVQLAAGLDYAHAKGVIHRDIKPGNVLVDNNDNVFILDFGIAQISATYGEGASGTSVALGTPGYMSPEQILNEKLDARSDVFSLAVLAFQCLAGKRPFAGANFTEVIGNILNGNRYPLSEFVMGMPLALEAEFERAFSRDRNKRFNSAGEMVEAFARASGVDLGSAKNANILRRSQDNWNAATAHPQNTSKDPRVAEPGKLDATTALIIKPGYGRANPDPIQPQDLRNPGHIFRDSDSMVGVGKVALRLHSSRLKSMLFLLGFVALGLGLTLLFVALRNRGGQVQSPSVVTKQQEVDTVAPEDPLGELIKPAVEEVPQGKQVNELTDKQLLGILIGHYSEDITLEALKEGARRKIPALVDAAAFTLKNDSYVIRVETIKAVGQSGDRRIVPNLMVLLDDHDPLVRGHTAKALGQLGDRRALAYLGSKLITEEIPEVKSAIKSAVEKISGFPVKE